MHWMECALCPLFYQNNYREWWLPTNRPKKKMGENLRWNGDRLRDVPRKTENHHCARFIDKDSILQRSWQTHFVPSRCENYCKITELLLQMTADRRSDVWHDYYYFIIFKSVLQELKELSCRNCNIKKVNPQVYHFLQHLGELDLGDNQVCFHSSACWLRIDAVRCSIPLH